MLCVVGAFCYTPLDFGNMKIIVLWNIIVFIIYGYDKRKSIKKKWRVRESVLLFLAVMLGGVGALAGMLFFRHKTRKRKFTVTIPLIILAELLVFFVFSDYF